MSLAHGESFRIDTSTTIDNFEQSKLMALSNQLSTILNETLTAWTTKCSAKSLTRRANLESYTRGIQRATQFDASIEGWSARIASWLNQDAHEHREASSMIKNRVKREKFTNLLAQMRVIATSLHNYASTSENNSDQEDDGSGSDARMES